MNLKQRTKMYSVLERGQFLVAAICAGARKAIGVEFPENTGYKLVLDAVVHRIALKYNSSSNCIVLHKILTR